MNYMRKRSMRLYLAVLLLIGTIPMGIQADTAEASEDWEEVYVLNNTVHYPTLQPNNRQIMVWNGDDVFLAYMKNDENGTCSSMLQNSTDGGRSWSRPVKVFNYDGVGSMKIELFIHQGELFLANKINFQDGNYYENRRLDCMVAPISTWNNSSTWKKTRLDAADPGYIGNTIMVGFGDQVAIFWQRSHVVDTLYRICENGSWGTTRALLDGMAMGWPSPIVTERDGEETVLVYFTYYEENTITMTSSTDCRNWTPPRIIFAEEPGAFSRLSVREMNDMYHLTVNNRWGNKVYYASSVDGFNWSGLRSISKFYYQGSDSIEISLTMGVHPDTNSLYIAHDNMTVQGRSTVEVHLSRDSGNSFSKVASFGKDHHARAPLFDGRCIYLLYVRNHTQLVIMELGGGVPENGTEPEDQIEETEDKDEQGPVLEGDPGNVSHEEEQESDGEHVAPTYPVAEYMETEIVKLSAWSIFPELEEDDVLWFEWYLGDSLVGTDDIIQLELGPGRYQVRLIVNTKDRGEIETSRIIDVKESREGDDGGSWFLYLIPAAAVLVSASIALCLFFIKRRKGKERGSPYTNETLSPSDGDVISGDLGEPELSPGLLEIRKEALGSTEGPSREALRRKARERFEDGDISDGTYTELRTILDKGQ